MKKSALLPKATLVVFSHGKESGPHGSKIEALARSAESEGCKTLSIDYREHPARPRHDHDAPGEPDRRVAQLLSTALSSHKRLVLVGSSMSKVCERPAVKFYGLTHLGW